MFSSDKCIYFLKIKMLRKNFIQNALKMFTFYNSTYISTNRSNGFEKKFYYYDRAYLF